MPKQRNPWGRPYAGEAEVKKARDEANKKAREAAKAREPKKAEEKKAEPKKAEPKKAEEK